jgi:hypothetical protein
MRELTLCTFFAHATLRMLCHLRRRTHTHTHTHTHTAMRTVRECAVRYADKIHKHVASPTDSRRLKLTLQRDAFEHAKQWLATGIAQCAKCISPV